MADIFGKMDKLFRHEPVADPPPAVVLHRFMVSDPDYAPLVKKIALEVRGDDLVYRIWQAIVPQMSERPWDVRTYTHPGSIEDPHPLVEKLMEAESWSREQAEQALELIELQGRVEQVAAQYGVELD